MPVNLKVKKVKKLDPEDRKKQKEQTNIFPTKKIFKLLRIYESHIFELRIKT